MGLPGKNNACISLLLLSDEPAVIECLQSDFSDPSFSFSTASLLDHHLLPKRAKRADVVVFYVGKFGFRHSMRAIEILRRNEILIKTLVIDTVATPERAVTAMKTGSDDYVAHNGEHRSLGR